MDVGISVADSRIANDEDKMMDAVVKENLGTVRRGEVHVEFTDQYGDTRVIHRLKGSKLAIKRNGNTPAHAMNRAAAVLIGQKIRAARLAAGLSLEELCQRAGLAAPPGAGKMRMYEIEKNIRQTGMRIGTLYAIAVALDIPVWSLLPSNEDVIAASGVRFEAIEGLTT